MIFREYQERDCQEIGDMFYSTVHSVNARDYTKEQLNVWASGSVDLHSWNASFLRHYTIVCLCDGKIVGFGDLDGDYFDRLYVHKDFQGRGIATAIASIIEEKATQNRVAKITVHASITAKLFFEKRGYITVKQQQVEKNGLFLTNFHMEKVV